MEHTFDVNNTDVIHLSNKLERLSKSAFPLAVRGTLNDAAFESRKLAIKNFKHQFIIREPKFITSHLNVKKSPNTFNINEMESEMGIPVGKSVSGDQLKIQETGGHLTGRNVPTEQARIGERKKALISKAYYQRMWKSRPKGRIYRSGESTIIKTDKALLRVKRGGIWSVLYLFGKDVTIEEKPFIVPAGIETMKQIGTIFGKQAKRRIEKELYR